MNLYRSSVASVSPKKYIIKSLGRNISPLSHTLSPIRRLPLPYCSTFQNIGSLVEVLCGPVGAAVGAGGPPLLAVRGGQLGHPGVVCLLRRLLLVVLVQPGAAPSPSGRRRRRRGGSGGGRRGDAGELRRGRVGLRLLEPHRGAPSPAVGAGMRVTTARPSRFELPNLKEAKISYWYCCCYFHIF